MDMIEYLKDPLYTNERLGGVSFLNDTLANFTYAIRLSYSPRNSGETELVLSLKFELLHTFLIGEKGFNYKITKTNYLSNS